MNRAVDILSKKSIDKLSDYLKKYTDNLQNKCELFCQELANQGYTVAIAKVSEYGRYGSHRMEDYIVFYTNTTSNGNGAESKLIGIGIPFESVWTSKGEIHRAMVKPLEMVEFGTGALAISPSTVFTRYGKSGGKGTFSIAGHQNETDWGANNNWTAITPTMPMYSAYLAMYMNMNNVAKKVFGVK